MNTMNRNGFWMVLAALVMSQVACVGDAADWNDQHPVGAAGEAGAGGTCDTGCGTGGTGGSNQICVPGLWVDGNCPNGQSGLFHCNPQGNGFDKDTCSNGSGGTGGGNNCGPTCCPNSTVSITCPNNTSGTATCNASGTGWSYSCNGGTGGSGGGTGGTGGSTGGTGGAPPNTSCQGDGQNHTMRVLCIAPANEVAVIDIKGGAVNTGDHRADNEATPWCEAWYNTPLAVSSVQGANVVLDYSRSVQGGIAPRFQTYFRVHAGDPDGNTPHGFSYPEVQLHSNWSCQVSLDGVNLTDSMGAPVACSSEGCAVRVTNATGDPKWINMQTDVYRCN